MKKWMPAKAEDFKNLQEVINKANKTKAYNIRLNIEVDEENGINTIELLDDYEELYYGGFLFNSFMEELDDAFRKDTGDDSAYFDCICPGRWLADYDLHYRYSIDDMQGEVSLAMAEAMCHYMESNDIQYQWTDELRDRYDRIEFCQEFMNFMTDLISKSKKKGE